MDPLGASIVQEAPPLAITQRAELPPPTPQKPARADSPVDSRSPLPLPRSAGSPPASRPRYEPPPSATYPASPPRTISPRSPIASNEHLRRPEPVAGPSSPASSEPRPTEPREPFVKIRILGMDRAKKDVWIKLDASSNLPSYHATHIKAFSRSFVEFLALHAALCANHPQAIVPALPIPATSAATEEEEDRLLKVQFQRWSDRVTRHPDLARDDELRLFLEAHFGYQPVTTKRRLKPSTSFTNKLSLRRSSEPSDGLTNIKTEMARLEVHFSDGARAIDKEGRNRKLLAHSLLDLSEQLAAYATTESVPAMTVAFRKVADGVRRLADLNNSLAIAECVTLADALMYESAEAKEAKDTLAQRQLIVEEHRSATKTAVSKKRAIEKIKTASNISRERVDEALEEYEEAERHHASLTQNLNAISKQLAPSLTNHTQHIHEDLFAALGAHARAGLAYERQALKDLDQLRKEIKAIPKIAAKDAGSYYVHPTSTADPAGSVASAAPSPEHARQSSLPGPMAPTHPAPTSPPRSSSDRMAQSMFVPPTHLPNSPKHEGLAKSVLLSPGAVDPLKARSLVDERRRVDARSAASSLAKMF